MKRSIMALSMMAAAASLAMPTSPIVTKKGQRYRKPQHEPKIKVGRDKKQFKIKGLRP